jgi:hypothetical protein
MDCLCFVCVLPSGALLAACFMMVSCMAYFSTLEMETCSSEMSIDIQQFTLRYILEDRTVHNRRSENLKSYILKELQTLEIN